MPIRKFKRRIQLINVVISTVMITVVFGIIVGYLGFRFDFESGSHRITPTALDSDFFGNYKVYYKTSDYTRDAEESFYYIAKGDDDLVEKINEAIINESSIMVYYDKYVGFKGIGSPTSAPIVKIESIKNTP